MSSVSRSMSRSKPPCLRRRLAAWLLASACGLSTGSHAAELLIVTARTSPVSALSVDEAEQLFLGLRTTLSNGTPVKLIDLPPGPARDAFYQQLTGKNPIQTRAYWSRQVFTGRALPPREADSLQEAQNLIADTPGTIGYLPAEDTDKRLRVLLTLP